MQMEAYTAISVKEIVMMLVILHVVGIGKHAHHVNTGLMSQDIVMIVPLQKVNGLQKNKWEDGYEH